MCDLTDPRIVEAYTAIVEDEPTNWLLLGYNDTRDVISLYSTGTEGLSEFRTHLTNEVLYGFLRIDDRFILITWVSEQVSGVRRARALVHSRSVASLLKLHQAQITASNLNDLSDSNIRTRLKLGDGPQPNSRRSSANLSQKKVNRRQSSIQSPVSPTSPISPRSPTIEEDEFVEARESPVFRQQEEFLRQQEEQRRLLEEKKREEQERTSREEEAKRSAAEQQEAIRLAAIEKERQQAAAIEKEKQEAIAAAQAEKEAVRLAIAEKESTRLEQERILKERQAAEEAEEEKRILQRKLFEAEKTKGVLLSGFLSVQPNSSPFWRRRYFILKGRSLSFYNDELQHNPVFILDLSNVKRINRVNVDNETFVPNAFILETQLNGPYQLFADDKKSLNTILNVLHTII